MRLAALVSLVLGSLSAAVPVKESGEFFEMRIRPLLAKNCFACHTASKLGGLEMASREHLLKGGNTGPAIVPGKPDESLLIQAVRRTHARFKMPPDGKLKDEEIADLTAWVAAGAVWPELENKTPKPATYVITPEQRGFWAFQPVRKLPVLKGKSAVDYLILARLEKEGLKPVKPADRRTLIRRVTFDLIGLPPTPEEVDAFVSDPSPRAFEKVVDRLLASPHYGERWGRHWLDLARYSDGKIGTKEDTPYPNAWRYRDWVIQAFNEDMPYDVFVKAQIAADLLPAGQREKLLPGLGFQALGLGEDDRVDVTTRVFLGLTVACAQCHDHKYDPIPTRDYYSVFGIFRSSPYDEKPLAPAAEVDAYNQLKKKIDEKQAAINDFLETERNQLSEILAAQTSRYMVAAWKKMRGEQPDDKLDAEILDRWVRYLKDPEKEHRFLQPWYDAKKESLDEVRKLAEETQALALAIFAEKKEIDDRNYVKLGGAKGVKDERTRQYANLDFLTPEKYYFWRDLASDPYSRNAFDFDGGIYYFNAKQIDRFLSGPWKNHLEAMRAELAALEKALPPQYPFLHALKESDKPANVRVAIRGDARNKGEEAPRRFLAVLCDGERPLFQKGSGRLELADAIASPANPLTARVMVNRIWQLHFGEGLVRTLSNFGRLGERPTHPELLDYLAARFIESGWSMKALHREILLSSTYARSASDAAPNIDKDPENRLLWRANLRPRLDAEALRDAMLAVSGRLDRTMGGAPVKLGDDNRRRTVYGLISRTKLDGMLALFDFPNPNSSSEHRAVTVGPMQRLFFLNNSFVAAQAKALSERLKGDEAARIHEAYRLLYGRSPTAEETRLGLDFLQQGAWPQYAQVLLSSAEFSAVD